MSGQSASSNRWLPWASSNLRRNPFGELSRQERAEVAVVDVPAMLGHLTGPRTALQFIGECGRGKTTRLLAIARHLPDYSYVYLPEDGPCPPIAAAGVVLIDEAQRLPVKARRAVMASGIPLILATHRNLSRHLRRYGYACHTECIGETNSAALVRRVLNRRIEASRLRKGPLPQISDTRAEELVVQFGSDIRGIEHHLYELLQRDLRDHGEVRSLD